MTDTDWRDGYHAAVAHFLKDKGKFVKIEGYVDDENPDEYDTGVLYYGWQDYNHLRDETRYGGAPACEIVIIAAHTMREHSIGQFMGTFHTGSDQEVGVEVQATCACDKYDGKWLRWTGSLSDILPEILNP